MVWVNSVLNNIPDPFHNERLDFFIQHSSLRCFDMLWWFLFQETEHAPKEVSCCRLRQLGRQAKQKPLRTHPA